jgi:hypothetical protein
MPAPPRSCTVAELKTSMIVQASAGGCGPEPGAGKGPRLRLSAGWAYPPRTSEATAAARSRTAAPSAA